MMSDVNKTWVRVCPLNHIPENKALDLNISGQRLVIARCGESASIMQGFCTHMLFPLAGSKVEDCVLTCGLHRSRFQVGDGSVEAWSVYPPLAGKTLAAIRESKALRTWETKVMDGDVYVLWAASDPSTVRVKV